MLFIKFVGRRVTTTFLNRILFTRRIWLLSKKDHCASLQVPVTKLHRRSVPINKEALLLENTLIKKHQPRYNLHLKDEWLARRLEADLATLALQEDRTGGSSTM